MANFPILQEIKGEWQSTKTVEIMGLRIPAYFTDDPQLLYDYIVNFKTKSDDVFVVSYPKAGQFVKIIFYLTGSPSHISNCKSTLYGIAVARGLSSEGNVILL